MVKVIDKELSGSSLAFRAISGALLAAGAFLLFSFAPEQITEMIGELARNAPEGVGAALSGLISPALPIVGLALVPVIFLCALFRGTKAYGPLTIALSLLFAAYVLVGFHFGSVSLQMPGPSLGEGGPSSLSVAVDISGLMALFLIPPIIGLVKGVLLIVKKD